MSAEKARTYSGDHAYFDGVAPLDPILDSLKVPRKRPVVVVIGWADANLNENTLDCLDLLLRRALTPAVTDGRAVVVSGGTDAGVMAALGAASSGEARGELILLGVAPRGRLLGMDLTPSHPDMARPEPRHKLLVTPGEDWGSEGPLLVRVAEHIGGRKSVVVLAVGGGEGTRRELVLAARRRWPVILVTGHGGASDEVAAEIGLLPQPGGSPALNDSPQPGSEPDGRLSSADRRQLLSAASEGCYAVADLEDRLRVERLLRWRLSPDLVLKDAWNRFYRADRAAIVQKKPTTAMALAVLILATLTVLSAAVAAWFSSSSSPGAGAWASIALKGLVTCLPLAAAVVLGLMDRRARTGTWISLRSTAEATLREIYRYRAAVIPYSRESPHCGVKLAEAISQLQALEKGHTFLLRGGSVQPQMDIWPPHLWDSIPHADTLVGPLTAKSYDQSRVLPQISYYERSASLLDRQATRLSATIFIVAAIAAFFLATSWRWPGLTVGAAIATSVAAALISWREYRQQDARAEKMLATCVALHGARSRWLANGPVNDASEDHLSSFVAEVEDVLAAEGTEWGHAMRQAHRSLLDRQRGR